MEKQSKNVILASTVRENITKAKFDANKITVNWEIDRRDTKEQYNPTIHDCGHTDLRVERHEVAKKVLHLLGCPKEWKNEARVEVVQRDLDDMTLKFEISLLLELSTERFVIKTPALNDLTFNDTEKLFQELGEFVTGNKRNQLELELVGDES